MLSMTALPAFAPTIARRRDSCLLRSGFELCFYGVGEGEAVPSAGEAVSEGDASVAGAFFLAAAFFLRAGDGDGDASVVAAVVEVAVVPCCGAQEAINAMPIRMAIKGKTDFFMGFY
jgi:hypothetical protein